MTTACIIQARLGSSRLPAKVLLPLPTGRTVLEEVIHRVEQIAGIDVFVTAIPDTPENDILLDFTRGVVVRGPEHDVLARYVKAAEAVKADVIMRVTADCPLIDPATCGLVLRHRADFDADYASNCFPVRHFPRGWDCEVFTREILDRAHAEAPHEGDARVRGDGRIFVKTGHEREHVTPWMQEQSDITRVTLKNSNNDRSHLRWTLDELSDYKTIYNVFEQQMRDAA